jgi:hypothetical protein
MEKKVLGRKEKITLPELGLNLVGAKIDTGAYTSSLHAEEIRIEEVEGRKLLYFKILMPAHKKFTGKTLFFESYREKSQKLLRASGGPLPDRNQAPAGWRNLSCRVYAHRSV